MVSDFSAMEIFRSCSGCWSISIVLLSNTFSVFPVVTLLAPWLLQADETYEYPSQAMKMLAISNSSELYTNQICTGGPHWNDSWRVSVDLTLLDKRKKWTGKSELLGIFSIEKMQSMLGEVPEELERAQIKRLKERLKRRFRPDDDVIRQAWDDAKGDKTGAEKCDSDAMRTVSLTNDEMDARDSNRTTANQLAISNFKGDGPEAKATLLQISEADWGHRRSDNYMSYAYLEKSLTDLKNHVFVGRVHEEICSLFVYRFTGRDSEDATILLLWTKDTWRRHGFCTKIMHEGIGFLDNSSLLMAGTSITPTSRAVFRSQQWNGIDDSMLSVLLRNLRKTLEKKRFQKGTRDDSEWEVKIPSCVLECYRAENPSRCRPREDMNNGNTPTDGTQERLQVLNDNDIDSTPIARKTGGTIKSHQSESSSKRPREDVHDSKERSSASSKKPRALTNNDAIPSSLYVKGGFNLPYRLSRLEEEVFLEAKAGKLLERVLNIEKQVGIQPKVSDLLLNRVETLEEMILLA